MAFDYFRKAGVLPVDFLQLFGGDHAFVVIGRKDNQGLQDFSTWTDAFICDPWGGIAFKACDFPIRWREQMLCWEADGMRAWDKVAKAWQVTGA